MSEIRKDLHYTKEHEWVRKTKDPKVVVVGITDFAQSSLGDVTFVDLPAIGTAVIQDKVFGSVESVKSVSDLFAPLSGKIIKRNEALLEDPAPLNTSPYDNGWLVEVELSNESEFSKLLSAAAYEQVAQ
jgi:glycine cleavage system H protein